MALATIKLATSAFVYLYNDETNEIEVCEALQPLTHDTHLEGDCYQGQMAFKHKKLTLTLDFTPSQVNVALDSQYLAIEANSTFNSEHQAQKITLSDNSIANLDWTLGYMRHETNWFWMCINSYSSRIYKSPHSHKK